MLINDAPKYGNDIDYVDELIIEAYDSYLDEIKKYPNTRYKRGPIGGIRYGGSSSISANVGQGMGTMATLTAAKLVKRSLKVARPLITLTKTVRLPFSNPLQSSRQKELLTAFCSIKK